MQECLKCLDKNVHLVKVKIAPFYYIHQNEMIMKEIIVHALK